MVVLRYIWDKNSLISYYLGDEDTETRRLNVNVASLTEGNKSKLSNLFLKMEKLAGNEAETTEQQMDYRIVIAKDGGKRKVLKEDKEKKEKEEKLFKHLYRILGK